MTTRKKISFIGLGAMGAPMAGHLVQKATEYTLCAHNRTPQKTDAWQKKYQRAITAASIHDAAKDASILITCVGNDEELAAVIHAALEVMPQGGLIIDHSTVAARTACALDAAAQKKSIGFCDAPVSGGTEGAQKGTLSVMLGGTDANVKKATPIIAHYAQTITPMGKVGNGQLTKMVNQICVAGLLQGLAEGLNFANAVGLNHGQLLRAIGGGAASSWQMLNRGQTMLKSEFDFGFKVNWMLKDLKIALAHAQRHPHHPPLEVTETIIGFYQDIQAMNGGAWDSSSLIARLEPKGNAASRALNAARK